MIPPLDHLRAALDGITPGLFNASVALVAFGLIYLLRRFRPALFARLPDSLQAWPALVVAAVMGALSQPDGPALHAVIEALSGALKGLVSGVLAVGVHHVLKESPLPYNGGTPPVLPTKTPRA